MQIIYSEVCSRVMDYDNRITSDIKQLFNIPSILPYSSICFHHYVTNTERDDLLPRAQYKSQTTIYVNLSQHCSRKTGLVGAERYMYPRVEPLRR